MRKEYIQKQKELGRKVLAVLPIHYPKEILTAMNILAVELWGPPGVTLTTKAGKIQSYVCPLVRNAQTFLSSGGCDQVDGLLVPHTCDSIQGLGSLISDFEGYTKDIIFYYHPKGVERSSARNLVRSELESLAHELGERITGKSIDTEALNRALRLHRDIDALRLKLIQNRPYIKMNDFEFYTLLRRGEFLWPEDHIIELNNAGSYLSQSRVHKGPSIMITGYVPEPMAIFKVINEAGAYVAADDYAAVGRRVVQYNISSTNDPFAELVEIYFSSPPCPTRTSNLDKRIQYLKELYKRSEAKGIILHTIKFCEPELFDVPVIRSHFSSDGVPLLHIESELEKELSGQNITRIEAFIEMLSV